MSLEGSKSFKDPSSTAKDSTLPDEICDGVDELLLLYSSSVKDNDQPMQTESNLPFANPVFQCRERQPIRINHTG